MQSIAERQSIGAAQSKADVKSSVKPIGFISSSLFFIGGALLFLFNERFWLGTSFRSGFGKNAIPESSTFATRRAIALLMDLFITEDIRFGYAYDFNLNSQNNYRNNSHEFSIGYYIQSKWLKSPEPRYF